MTTMSTTAWALHDVGLATAIGGTLFGRTALEPALDEIPDPADRDRVSSDAWRRFSWLNLIAHGVFAGTWFYGRTRVSGAHVGGSARMLIAVKDGLVVASLVTGLTTVVLGRILGKRADHGRGPEQMRAEHPGTKPAKRTQGIERTVGALGILNLMTNVAIASVTNLLAMEGNKSVRFAARSRRLP